MSKGKPKKPTPNQQALQTEITRINRLVGAAKAHGIVFIEPPYVPPTRVTKKQLDLAKSLDYSTIRAKGYVIDTETGELLKPEEILPSRKKHSDIYLRHPRVGMGEVLQNRVSTPSYKYGKGSRLKTHKRKLTEEELHIIRSNAAAKAAATRREKLIHDPEYAAKMHEIWSQSAKKIHNSIKVHMEKDPAFAEHMREVWRKAGERLQASKKKDKVEPVTPIAPPQPKPPKIETPKPTPPTPPTEDRPPQDYDNTTDEPVSVDQVILEQFRDTLYYADGAKAVTDYIVSIFDDMLDELGEAEVADRIRNIADEIMDCVEGITYASKQSSMFSAASKLIFGLFNNSQPDPVIMDMLADKVEESRDWGRKWR